MRKKKNPTSKQSHVQKEKWELYLKTKYLANFSILSIHFQQQMYYNLKELLPMRGELILVTGHIHLLLPTTTIPAGHILGAWGAGHSLGSPLTSQGLLHSWRECLHQVQACIQAYLIQRVDENQGLVYYFTIKSSRTKAWSKGTDLGYKSNINAILWHKHTFKDTDIPMD